MLCLDPRSFLVPNRALDSLFGVLKQHGGNFKIEFWKRICDEVLFPIFGVLRSKQDISRFASQEAMSVWLSTTLISALRSLIELFTVYFETLQAFLEGLLDLLCACICQGERPRGSICEIRKSTEADNRTQKTIPLRGSVPLVSSSCWRTM